MARIQAELAKSELAGVVRAERVGQLQPLGGTVYPHSIGRFWRVTNTLDVSRQMIDAALVGRVVSMIWTAVLYILGVLVMVHDPRRVEWLIERIVCPVETREILVPRTPATTISVPIEYDPVSVRIRHQRDQFERRAEAIVCPVTLYPISSDTVVSPSRRRSERSSKMIVISHPGAVFTISHDRSTFPVELILVVPLP